MQRYNAAKAAGVNIRGIWIQDWAGIVMTSFGQRLFWNWKWNATTYPGIMFVTKGTHRYIKTGMYVNICCC